MSVSVFDHPVLSGLLGDGQIASFFSIEAELKAMLDFEAALAAAEAEKGVIPEAAAKAIAKAIQSFRPDIERLRHATARDGVVVPELVRQLRAEVGEPHAGHVHFGATSQDVIDTGFALRIDKALGLLQDRIDDDAIPEDERSKLRKARDAFAAIGRDVAVGVLMGIAALCITIFAARAAGAAAAQRDAAEASTIETTEGKA